MTQRTAGPARAVIPLHRVEPGDEPALRTLHAEPERLAALIAVARRTYTPLGLRVVDRMTRPWAARNASPYARVVEKVDNVIPARSVFALNYSYEWGCTTGVQEAYGAPVLLRTLDWPLAGLGRNLIAVEQQGEAGPFLNVTWPGFVGVLTAMAPGRFAASINQPPLPFPVAGMVGGWIASRIRVKNSTAMPPTHLLRLAFETSPDYASALTLLSETPICLPVLYTLAGTRPGEAAVIERTETEARVLTKAQAANHWTSSIRKGTPREASSRPRFAAMEECLARGAGREGVFDWLSPPILQADTRVAVMASPARGTILAQGWEAAGRATETFRYEANSE